MPSYSRCIHANTKRPRPPGSSVLPYHLDTSRQPLRRFGSDIQSLVHIAAVLIDCRKVKAAQSHDERDLELHQRQRLTKTGPRTLLERPPRILGHKVRVRGISDEMALGVEPLGVLEQVLAPHGGAVVDEDGEGVGRPFLAVLFQVLTRLSAPQADPRWRPESQNLLDYCESVAEIVDELGIRSEHICGARGVFAKECLVLLPNSLENIGVLAKRSIRVLTNELAGVRVKLVCAQTYAESASRGVMPGKDQRLD